MLDWWAILSTLGTLFATPLLNFSTLWIIIPVYLNWLFTEIFQEKKGTDLGNAITNGAVAVWVGMDWGRTTTQAILAGELALDSILATKIAIITFFLIYGFIIIVEGIRMKKITHYIGRIREVTYFALVMTPIFYGVVEFNLTTILAILLGFPIFYGIIELICRITPTPQTYDEDQMPSAGADMPDLGKGAEMPQMPELGAGGAEQMPDLTGQNLGGLPKI